MAKDTVDEMVDRFLSWRLPDGFCPDCYVSFDREAAKRNSGWPVGTNLLTAEQARAMVLHILGDDGFAPAEPSQD